MVQGILLVFDSSLGYRRLAMRRSALDRHSFYMEDRYGF